jgi:hypothetical protein
MVLGGATGVGRDLFVDATVGVAGAVLAGKRHTVSDRALVLGVIGRLIPFSATVSPLPPGRVWTYRTLPTT